MKTPYDYALLATAILASIPFVLANGVIFWYRKRRIFQIHGVWLILGGSFAGLMWIFSSFVVNEHFSRKRGPLSNCTLWTFWLHGTFGLSSWFTFVILRLHRSFCLLTNTRTSSAHSSDWKYGVYIVLLLLPAATLSVVASLGQPYETSDERCKLKVKWWIRAWLVMVLPYFICFLLLLIRMRGTKDAFLVKEYNHTCQFMFLACLIIVLTWVALITTGYSHISGRCFVTFCENCLVFFHFWSGLGRPIYDCLYQRSAPEEIEAEPTFQYLPSSEGAALEAMANAAEKLEIFKEKICELQIIKANLEAKLQEKILLAPSI